MHEACRARFVCVIFHHVRDATSRPKNSTTTRGAAVHFNDENSVWYVYCSTLYYKAFYNGAYQGVALVVYSIARERSFYNDGAMWCDTVPFDCRYGHFRRNYSMTFDK
jgi:hypothetical protein